MYLYALLLVSVWVGSQAALEWFFVFFCILFLNGFIINKECVNDFKT